jgi:hypothetical protein
MELAPELGPLQNAARVRRKAHRKLSPDSITSELREYFAVKHATTMATPRRFSSHRIGDVITLTLTLAEIFSDDPNRWLLDHGIVIFPELVCLAIQKFSEFISMDAPACLLSLEKNRFSILDELPHACVGRLKQLGFIDSVDFQLFLIPASDSLAFAIRSNRALVQPLPTELIESLLAVKQTAVLRARAAIREYVAAIECGVIEHRR